MNTTASPQWTDLLNKDSKHSVRKEALSTSQKKKKAHVSPEQREVLLYFVLENPEIVTHSSTRENEQSLWSDLTEKLNAMLPEKSVIFWKDYWKRWVTSIDSKTESSLTLIDYKLKKFLKNITANDQNFGYTQKITIRRKLSIDEINKNLNEIEAEKTKLKLDIDKMEYSILSYKAQIMEMKKSIALKRNKCQQLSIKKANLNSKKRKIEERGNMGKLYYWRKMFHFCKTTGTFRINF